MATRSRATARASTSTTSKFGPGNKRYQHHGAGTVVWKSHDKEVLLSGPAGTGKSRSILEKIYAVALKYPGCRVLIARKTRASLTDTILVTLENDVIPAGSPLLDGPTRATRRSYVLPNGSEIVLGGLDKITKVLSGEYDLIYVPEAIEADENDVELLTTRLRHNRLPYQQLVMDTNPDKPTHWLIQRCNRGQTRMVPCRHEDNPTLFDPATGEVTARGASYIATLDALTGVRKQRFRYGRWVQAEGVVYGEYDAAVHLIDRFEIPPTWRRFVTVDFGYRNAFVCQWWAEDPDGRLYRYREIYHTGRTVAEHAPLIVSLSEGERIDDVVCDHDAEDRATLEQATGWTTTAAKKSVSDGIQAVKERLKAAGDGRPRLFLLRDSLVERDPALDEAKKPCCTEEEFDGYVWAKPASASAQNAQKRAEEPVKRDDHGMDDLRYAVASVDLVPETVLLGVPASSATPSGAWTYTPR